MASWSQLIGCVISHSLHQRQAISGGQRGTRRKAVEPTARSLAPSASAAHLRSRQQEVRPPPPPQQSNNQTSGKAHGHKRRRTRTTTSHLLRTSCWFPLEVTDSGLQDGERQTEREIRANANSHDLIFFRHSDHSEEQMQTKY